MWYLTIGYKKEGERWQFKHSWCELDELGSKIQGIEAWAEKNNYEWALLNTVKVVTETEDESDE